MYCKKCGAEISDDSRFCKECGELISEEGTNNKSPSNSPKTTTDKSSNENNSSISRKEMFEIGLIILILAGAAFILIPMGAKNQGGQSYWSFRWQWGSYFYMLDAGVALVGSILMILGSNKKK